MSDPAESPREVDPLKGREVDGAANGTADSARKKSGCGGKLSLSRLSGWRTAAFLFSLFLCLTIVFAFSFILPCPVRPQYVVAWNRTIPAAAAYNFLAVEDTNNDKVKDVIIIYKSREGSQNNTCEHEGLPSPCLLLLVVDGTDGETIWERPLASDLTCAKCGLEGLDEQNKGCLLVHDTNITAINIYSGVQLWQHQLSSDGKVVAPILSVPDMDGDGQKDFVLLMSDHTQMKLKFHSGKTGKAIGEVVELASEVTSHHLMHTTANGAQYLLMQTDTGMITQGLWSLAQKANISTKLKMDPEWEKMRNGFLCVQRVFEVSGGKSVPSLLLIGPSEQLHHCTNEVPSMELLRGDSLTSMWKINTSKLLSEPSFGHFNQDHIPDVVIEEDAGNNTKKVMILDGNSGGLLWNVSLLTKAHTPWPSSVLTLYSYSVFMMWGEKQSQTNDTNEFVEERFSYLLHPLHSNLLLERSNPVEDVIAFKATLLERGRHASYLILNGPSANEGVDPDLAKSVVLTKRKLKKDIDDSNVLRVGEPQEEPVSKDNEDYIKEAFNRLRFSDSL
ncbi:protein FAM234A [Denticeps clupeoides]|uniref:FAM234A/B beta-propeller domain-containing protein n=1 Tax=Denticeps clupeoides TaxID=299321 RepID=A0AAY3ZUQ0_9TELE|nr:protein FAM234A [Denticeps clupeoides]